MSHPLNQKIRTIEGHFRGIMTALKLDLKDDSLKETPNRVAKMIVNETCKGLFTPAPVAKLFLNKFPKNQIVLERNINFSSICEHHWQNITGVAHIAYLPNKHVIGLSKLHRITDWYASRPQLQERLTEQIGEHLKKVIKTNDVAVIIKADHFCCKVRGVKDLNSDTVTAFLSGAFYEGAARMELYQMIKL